MGATTVYPPSPKLAGRRTRLSAETHLARLPSKPVAVASELALEFRAQLGLAADDPIDIGIACRMAACEVRYYVMPESHLHSALVPMAPGRFRIAVIQRGPTSLRGTPREGFLILHEIAHS